MAKAIYRTALPQLNGDLYLTDAGIETDLIFNHGIEIREFAAHTLLSDPATRSEVERYFQDFIELAGTQDTGLILDTVTWKAHRHWSQDLQQSAAELRAANLDSVSLAAALRAGAANRNPIVINAVIGPRGDAYRPVNRIEAADARSYYAEQLGWLRETEADMVSGLTFNQASEATGLVQAASDAGIHCAISFTVETNGKLPDGQELDNAIQQVDEETAGAAVYFMINCAHPDHFNGVIGQGDWRKRIRGIRANASRKSHAELDAAPELDDGDPQELGELYAELAQRMPWLNIFGGCCGSDLRHIKAIAAQVSEARTSS